MVTGTAFFPKDIAFLEHIVCGTSESELLHVLGFGLCSFLV